MLLLISKRFVVYGHIMLWVGLVVFNNIWMLTVTLNFCFGQAHISYFFEFVNHFKIMDSKLMGGLNLLTDRQDVVGELAVAIQNQ